MPTQTQESKLAPAVTKTVKPAKTPKAYVVKHPDGVHVKCPECGISATAIKEKADKEGNRALAPGGGLVQHYKKMHSTKAEALLKGDIKLTPAA